MSQICKIFRLRRAISKKWKNRIFLDVSRYKVSRYDIRSAANTYVFVQITNQNVCALIDMQGHNVFKKKQVVQLSFHGAINSIRLLDSGVEPTVLW